MIDIPTAESVKPPASSRAERLAIAVEVMIGLCRSSSARSGSTARSSPKYGRPLPLRVASQATTS